MDNPVTRANIGLKKQNEDKQHVLWFLLWSGVVIVSCNLLSFCFKGVFWLQQLT